MVFVNAYLLIGVVLTVIVFTMSKVLENAANYVERRDLAEDCKYAQESLGYYDAKTAIVTVIFMVLLWPRFFTVAIRGAVREYRKLHQKQTKGL